MAEALVPCGEWWSHICGFAQGSVRLCQMGSLPLSDLELDGEM